MNLLRTNLIVLFVFAFFLAAGCAESDHRPQQSSTESPRVTVTPTPMPTNGSNTGSVYVRPTPIEDYPKLVRPNLSKWPGRKTDEGKLRLFNIHGLEVQVDPELRDPITAAGDCTSLVTKCFTETNYTDDQCMVSVPSCQTEYPWNEEPCCPRQCIIEYEALRRRGTPDREALLIVLAGARTPAFLNFVSS